MNELILDADFSEHKRRFTRLKVESYNQYAIKTLKEGLGDQLLIWDVYSLGSGQSQKEKSIIASCPSNHMHRIGTDQENIILMNMLLSKDQVY